MKFKSSERAFTLIEVLTAVAISSILLAAIGSLLLGSFQVVKLIDSRKDAALESALIALESMAAELQTAPVYSPKPMEADSSSISFSELVGASSESDPFKKAFRLGQVQNVSLSASSVSLEKVEYSFDASAGTLIRSAGSAPPKILAEHLSGVKIFYALRSPEGDDPLFWKWESSFKAGEGAKLKAIRIVLTLQKEGLRYVVPSIEKTFLITRPGGVQ